MIFRVVSPPSATPTAGIGSGVTEIRAGETPFPLSGTMLTPSSGSSLRIVSAPDEGASAAGR